MKIYKNLIVGFLVIFCISCRDEANQNNHLHQGEVSGQHELSYNQFLKTVANKRHHLKNAETKKIGDYFFSLLNNDIPQYWTGTIWDFNGTTRIPQQGSIACGYFVTNTLSDLGFNIQRIKLAQVVSSEMIKTLCVNVKTISGFKQFQEYMNAQPAKSVFIVGLDFHTGYIIKDEKESYFLHSNYIQKKGVTEERIDDSKALANSKVYVVGSLTQNKKLLEDWVKH